MDTEKEIQARVEFKLQQIMDVVVNTTVNSLDAAIRNSNVKYSYYLEALEKIKQIFRKEIDLPVPYDEMSEHTRKQKRDRAVDEIMFRFRRQGTTNQHNETRFLVRVIEDAQKY